jgi:hypothetical protein
MNMRVVHVWSKDKALVYSKVSNQLYPDSLHQGRWSVVKGTRDKIVAVNLVKA